MMWLSSKKIKNGFEAEILFPESAYERNFSLVVVRRRAGAKLVAQKEVPLHYPRNARQGNPKMIDVLVADSEAEDLLKAAIRKEKKKTEEIKNPRKE